MLHQYKEKAPYLGEVWGLLVIRTDCLYGIVTDRSRAAAASFCTLGPSHELRASLPSCVASVFSASRRCVPDAFSALASAPRTSATRDAPRQLERSSWST